MLNMMMSQIYETVLEKCNYESLFCMVLLKAVVVLLKTKCNVTCYTAYVSSTFNIFLMNKKHNELERVQSEVNDPQCQMMDLLTSSMVWIAEQLFFCLKTSVS